MSTFAWIVIALGVVAAVFLAQRAKKNRSYGTAPEKPEDPNKRPD